MPRFFGFIRKTWFWEQFPAVVLIALSTHRAGGFDPLRPFDALVSIWASAIVTIAGVKMQSIADREAAEFREKHPDAAARKDDHHVECNRAKSFYSVLVQFGGVFARVVSGDPYGFALAVRAALYPAWRRVYMARIRPVWRSFRGNGGET